MPVRGKAGNFRDNVVKEAKKQNVPVESVSMSEQQRLLEDDGAPTPSVQSGKMLAKFMRPHFELYDDDRMVELEFSIALSDAHKSLVHSEVLDAWKFLDRHHPKGIVGIEIPAHTVDLFLSPDMSSELHLVAAEITSAKLSTVEKTGDGKTEKITRLQFRVVAELGKNVTQFATANYGNAVWIKMEAAQGVLAAD